MFIVLGHKVSLWISALLHNVSVSFFHLSFFASVVDIFVSFASETLTLSQLLEQLVQYCTVSLMRQTQPKS